MDRSWLTIPQNLEAYTIGINLFLDQAVANDYKNTSWRHHVVKNIGEQNVAIEEKETGDEVAGMHDFLNDVFVQPLTEECVRPSTEPLIGERRPEEVETFFRLLEEANQDLWSGCKEFKKLEAVHMAEYIRWHATECLKDEFMRHPLDSPAWKHLDNLYLDFASEIQNARLGLANDGFNPFGKMRHDHNTWPVDRAVLDGVHMAIKHVHIACMIKNLFTCRRVVRFVIWGHQRFLEDNHRFRRQTINFNGRREHSSALRQWTGLQCLEELSKLRFTFGKPNKDASVGQRRKRTSGSTSSNSQHNLDVMHIEKNICDSVVGTLLDIEKSKDGLAAHADLEVFNIRRSQHPRREGNRTFLPPTLFMLKREEKTAFCKMLSTIRVPNGYCSNLSRCVHVNERKIHELKSHDCHVLMQQLLSVAIRPVLPKAVTMILSELSAIFRQLCSKKEFEEGFKQLNLRIALTLCQLEKIFPPAFFDIMVHLPIHLADEAAIAGHVQYRWMYPIERYLQTLKRYGRNKGRPKEMSSLVALVEAEMKMVLDVECLMNSRCHPNDTLISQDLCWLANYPNRVVSRYKSHIVHGFKFRIKSMDDKHTNQNCGVFLHANVSGAIGQVNCYSRVVDMFEVKYYGHAEPGNRGRAVMLFKCEWVNSESPRGMKTDQYGFTMDTIKKDWHVVVRTQPRDLFDVLEDSDAIEDYAVPNLDDQILDHENFHTRVGVEETHFHESLPLPTQFASNANADDDTTDDDME
ncbi:unnamed protein product [Malus baccata var. baccata]